MGWRNHTEQELIEQLMTMHWDMAMCLCGACEYGRSKGYAPRSIYMPPQPIVVDSECHK